jgi:two-component system, sensor histidine kinase
MKPTQAVGRSDEIRNSGLNGHGLHSVDTSVLAVGNLGDNVSQSNDIHILIEQIGQLVLANRRKDEFLAILSHELCSPLASIQHGIGVLRSRSGSETTVQRGMHELIERQVRQMSALAAELLDVDRISSGRLLAQPERIELQTLLSNALDTAEPNFGRRTQTSVTTWAPTNIWVMADAGSIEQVFTNLLANASKYTDAGGTIAVSVSAQDGQAIVRIQDCGVGSARSSSWMVSELALDCAVVELHGGTVTALSSGTGRGSEFVVRLPAEV